MKYYTFYREDNKFDDILKDPVVKKNIKQSNKWYQHLELGFDVTTDAGTYSYIVVKYGDDIKTKLTEDYSPVPNKDYIVKR